MHPDEWNALREGQSIYVHRPLRSELHAERGTVVTVQMTGAEHAIAVRLDDADGESHVVWPRRLASHLEAVGAAGDCWRCELPGRPVVERFAG